MGVKVRLLGRRAGAKERERLVSIRDRGESAEQAALLTEARHFSGLGRLLAGAAHDCSNLLTPLVGYCELLRAKLPADSSLLSYTYEIERSARLAGELMHRLRDRGRSQPALERQVPADRSLIEVANLLRSLVGRTVEVSQDLRAGDLAVPLRAGEIEQIVLNLAANARDAMPLGGRLTLKTRGEGDRLWILEIEDTGGGISPENLERIFDPSFTSKALGKGTGLGLWIVRSIVEEARGSVRVRSALGRGTTVRVELPATRAAAPDAPAGLP